MSIRSFTDHAHVLIFYQYISCYTNTEMVSSVEEKATWNSGWWCCIYIENKLFLVSFVYAVYTYTVPKITNFLVFVKRDFPCVCVITWWKNFWLDFFRFYNNFSYFKNLSFNLNLRSLICALISWLRFSNNFIEHCPN